MKIYNHVTLEEIVSFTRNMRPKDRSDAVRMKYGIDAHRETIRNWIERIDNPTKSTTSVAKTDFDIIKLLENKVFRSVLIIPDMHIPYNHPEYFKFLVDIKAKINPDLVICIGDELDHHAMSFHDSDPDLDSAGKELIKAREILRALAYIFPEMYLCHSNHGSMAYRRSKASGISKHYLLPYRDVIFADKDKDGNIIRNELGSKWYWGEHIIFNTPRGLVKAKHGEGKGLATSDLASERMSVVRGHWHSQFNINYSASSKDLIYCMTVGCGIDNHSLAFEYNKMNNNKPIIGCGVIIDGVPSLIPMNLGRK